MWQHVNPAFKGGLHDHSVNEMLKGASMDNDIQCWWRGAPIQEHGTSEYGKLNIGFLCDHEKWVREQMPPS
ncbi:MAG: hypothetical protein JRN53_03035 [Nitrososphaerota archaeon]|jgi:hypothetical protein|nr:hypothetical protein [Nitrososphaerota archaeon]